MNPQYNKLIADGNKEQKTEEKLIEALKTVGNTLESLERSNR